MKFIFPILLLSLVACTKHVGVNPALALSDKALLDSCKKEHFYYRGNSALLPAKGPHGAHKLRMNTKALSILDSAYLLPPGKVFPPGALIVKDTYEAGTLTIYSLMYKSSTGWIWYETRPDGELIHSVNQNPSVCTSCHGQSGNMDMVLSLN